MSAARTCACPCHTWRGDSGSGYTYVYDDDRGIRHEDWISCGCENADASLCTKEVINVGT